MITSKDNAKIKELVKLYKNKKYRDEKSLFIVEGYNLIDEAIKASRLISVYSIKEEEKYKDAVIISKELLSKITNTITPEGIIGVVKKENSSKIGNKVLYLDRLQDPGNIGTLLRSSIAFNFDTVILDECVDIYNPKVVRSSEGAIFHLNFIKESLLNLKNNGYYLIGTTLDGISVDNLNHNLCKKIVLILGNEGNGIRKEYQDITDINLTISMNKIESLNVGVAGSIFMYLLK